MKQSFEEIYKNLWSYE